MAEPIIELRDIHGPFKGMVRPYLKSAGENAIATGFAERIEAPVTEVAPAAVVSEVEAGPAPAEKLSRRTRR